MDPLTLLAKRYKTDKWGKHHYTPIYHDLFNDRRHEVKKVIEIGIAEGAGLRMFRDYFINAKVYGAEIDPNRMVVEERIESMVCNQSFGMDLTDLVAYTGPDIDLCVDDGSHDPEDQVFSCLTLMPLLKKGVVYVIEDVSEPSIIGKLAKYDLKLITAGKRYDDRLVIVKHPYV